MNKVMLSTVLVFAVIAMSASTIPKDNNIDKSEMEENVNIGKETNEKHEIQNKSGKGVRKTNLTNKKVRQREGNKKSPKKRQKNKENKTERNINKRKHNRKPKSKPRKFKKNKRKESRMKINLKIQSKKTGNKPMKHRKGSTKEIPSPFCLRQTNEIFCPVEKASSLKLLYNQVFNFKKQLKRAKNHANIVKKKKDKSGIFQKDAVILTDVVGGDLKTPSCLANTRSGDTAASKGSILANCSSTISTSCKNISINTTLTGTCSDNMDAFEAKITECRGSDCTCWKEAAAMKSGISKCNALKESDNVKTKKKKCLNTFSTCKKAQDSAVEFTATCPAAISVVTIMAVPTTAMLTTEMTSMPTTLMPTTAMPTTAMPTTAMQTKAMPTTEMPTAAIPSIAMPTISSTSMTKVASTTRQSSNTTISLILEQPVSMDSLETPVLMLLETPVAMLLETPVSMTPTATTKASNRKDRSVLNYIMAKSFRNFKSNA